MWDAGEAESAGRSTQEHSVLACTWSSGPSLIATWDFWRAVAKVVTCPCHFHPHPQLNPTEYSSFTSLMIQRLLIFGTLINTVSAFQKQRNPVNFRALCLHFKEVIVEMWQEPGEGPYRSPPFPDSDLFHLIWSVPCSSFRNCWAKPFSELREAIRGAAPKGSAIGNAKWPRWGPGSLPAHFP